MSSLVRVGIVGAGFAAQLHWEGYQRVYDVPVKVIGVTSKTAQSREDFAHKHGIRAIATVEELCELVDVIDICAPGFVHEPLALCALSHGKHVIIEKPFTGYYGPAGTEGESFRGDQFSKKIMLKEALASCERILSTARSHGRQICYAENWVYSPAIAKEREILQRSGGQILWQIRTVALILPITAFGSVLGEARLWARDVIP